MLMEYSKREIQASLICYQYEIFFGGGLTSLIPWRGAYNQIPSAPSNDV
jgi:hypothetical protein